MIAGLGLAIWIGFSLFAAIGLGNLGQAEGGEDMFSRQFAHKTAITAITAKLH